MMQSWDGQAGDCLPIAVSGSQMDSTTKGQAVTSLGPVEFTSVITSKAANGYHFKTGQRDWPSRTENVLPCRLL